MKLILAIAAGGAIGALARHFSSLAALRLAGPDFPWGTLAINIAGSLVMGLLVALFANLGDPPQEVKAFLTVGFLGAFTTFSAFSLDAALLWERGETLAAAGYVFASVALSIAGLFAGLALGRAFAA